VKLRAHAFAGLGVLAAVALRRNVPHLQPGALNWAENGNVAAALLQGRGFSDPFSGGTGATAWVPPLPVWIDAVVFSVAGIKTAAAARILLALAVAGLAGAHALLLSAGSLSGGTLRQNAGFRWAASIGFLALLLIPPGGPFEVQSEAWLDILLSALLLWAAVEHVRSPRPAATLGLAAVSVLGPLAHAGLALATACVLVALAWRDLRAFRRPSVPLIAAAAAVLAMGLWTVRNAEALGRLVPLKSNGWFEFHLANVASPNGLLRAETALRRLPFFNTLEFERYSTLGEARYVESFRAPSLAAVAAHPAHFAGNVGRRLVNALAFCQREDGSEITRAHFNPADLGRLVASGELLPLGGTDAACWLRIDDSPAAARGRLASLGLSAFPAVWRNWLDRREAYDAEYRSPRALACGFLIAGAPLLALLGAALGARGSPPAPAAWAALIAGAMVLPFVLVNHGVRHQMPLIAMQAVFFGACAQVWASRIRGVNP